MARTVVGADKIKHLLPYVVVGIVGFGLIMVGNASVVDAARDFGDKWYYLKLQAGWAALGLVAFWLVSRYPHQKLEKVAKIGLIVIGILLVAVLIPGISSRILGARRWISLGIFSFQPAELAKLVMVIFWAKVLTKPKDALIPFVVSLVGVATLVMLEPDLGTTLILVGTGFFMYFGSGGKMKYILLFAPLAAVLALGLIWISPYRRSRLITYFDHSVDPQGSSYHIRQVLLSLGSGGVWGVGLGQSRQKYEFLPEVTTDSIFAVVGEELGLLGTTAVVLVFGLFFWIGMKVAKDQDDKFGQNLALGLTGWISLQAVLNMSAMVALVPLTGIPLPFISYGGSSLLVALISCGILWNISRSN